MLTATQLAKTGSEHAHQVALFAYVAIVKRYGWDLADAWDAGLDPKGMYDGDDQVPELRWLHAIPNGGSRGDSKASAMRRGADLKAEGVKAGVADMCLPVKRGPWSGLYIEMKRPALEPRGHGKGGLSKEQIEFRDFVKEQGFGWVVCYGWRQAATVLQQYLCWNP